MLLDRALDALFPPRCLGCGCAGTALCARCAPPLEAARTLLSGELAVTAVGRYAGALRDAILAMKNGRRVPGERLAALVAERCGPFDERAVLVPVPTTLGRRRERGFDQSVVLARGVGERLGRPVLVALRQCAGDAQRGRSRSARLAARGRFACEAAGLVAGTRVVLVDDVVTTGATVRDCAVALAACGADVIGAAVVAYA